MKEEIIIEEETLMVVAVVVVVEEDITTTGIIDQTIAEITEETMIEEIEDTDDTCL